MQAVLGILALIALAWLCSEAKREVPWRAVLAGLGVQLVLAFLLIRVPVVAELLLGLNVLVEAIERATLAGTEFLFGYLGGGEAPFAVTRDAATYLFAFRVLPQVIVFSVIVAILWHWRVLPAIVNAFGWVLRHTLAVSGPVGTAGAATLFLGMVETPLVIRGYLLALSRAEFFCVMTFGMATVAGSVMVLYAGILGDVMPGVIGHILSASLINVVGAIYVARVMIPGDASESMPAPAAGAALHYRSFMDAITRGTADGVTLAINVGAMLLVLISLIALVNGLLGAFEVGEQALSLQRILGWLFAPVAWLIGIPWHEAPTAGSLLGTKLVLNELVAYLDLAALGDEVSPSSRLILIYAICGFANAGSLGILIGGLSTLVPERRDEFLAIAPRTLVSGTLVTLLTGAIVAVVTAV